MNTTNGKIAEQSKQKFIDVLLIIMKQYDYSDITITQLAGEAGLARKTFYRIFTDKDDMLNHFFDSLLKDCIMQIRSSNIHHYWELVQLYFDFWESRRTLLALLKRHNLLGKLFDFSYHHSKQVFEYVRSVETAEAFGRELPYLLAYAVGGMHSMLLKWVDNDMSIPASELIEKLKTGFMSVDI